MAVIREPITDVTYFDYTCIDCRWRSRMVATPKTHSKGPVTFIQVHLRITDTCGCPGVPETLRIIMLEIEMEAAIQGLNTWAMI